MYRQMHGLSLGLKHKNTTPFPVGFKHAHEAMKPCILQSKRAGDDGPTYNKAWGVEKDTGG